jgi:hypothetical protein
MAAQQPQVGGHVVAGREQQHVAGHDLLHRHRHRLAAAQRLDLARAGLGQGLDGALRLALGDEADDAVDHHHAEDHRRVQHAAGGHRDAGGDRQQAHRQAVELADEDGDVGALLGGRQRVLAEAPQPLRSRLASLGNAYFSGRAAALRQFHPSIYNDLMSCL